MSLTPSAMRKKYKTTIRYHHEHRRMCSAVDQCEIGRFAIFNQGDIFSCYWYLECCKPSNKWLVITPQNNYPAQNVNGGKTEKLLRD